MATERTVRLPALQVLTVTAVGLDATLYRLRDGGGEPYTPVVVSVGTPVAVGPFGETREYAYADPNGNATHALTIPDPDTATSEAAQGVRLDTLETRLAEQASANQTAVTDNTGGSVADAVAAVVTAPTALAANLTDFTGDSGTHDDTLADGLSATAPAAITNYTAHASGAVPVVSAGATDLDTTAAALATLENEVTALRGTVAACVTDLTVQNQNDSDLAQKVIELVTAQAENRAAIVSLTNGLAKCIELTNAHRTALVAAEIEKGSA